MHRRIGDGDHQRAGLSLLLRLCNEGGGYYFAEGWMHIGDIAPLDDYDFDEGEMVLDISANAEVSIIEDREMTGIAAAGFGFVGCCLGILVLIVGLVLWAVLDDPAPTMTYAQQGYVQPGMQTVGAVPGTYGAPGMVQAPVQAVPNAAGILPAQPVQPGMGAVVPGAVVGAYAVPDPTGHHGGASARAAAPTRGDEHVRSAGTRPGSAHASTRGRTGTGRDHARRSSSNAESTCPASPRRGGHLLAKASDRGRHRKRGRRIHVLTDPP